MDISPIHASSTDGQATQAGSLRGGQKLGQQDFLLMLLTQLNNQDPLNPMEGHEFAAQLAQFTSVEQLLSLNDTLAGQGELFNLLAETMGESLVAQGQMLGMLSESLNRSAATDLIGLSVEAPGDTVAWHGSAPMPLAFSLDAPAAALSITIRDAHGEAVRTLTLDGGEAGGQYAAWDGLDADGNPLPEGIYTFEVEAVDAEGNPVNATPLIQGIVDRVGFGPDGVVVWVNGQPVPYTDIRSIGWPLEDPALADAPPGDGSVETPTPEAGTF